VIVGLPVAEEEEARDNVSVVLPVAQPVGEVTVLTVAARVEDAEVLDDPEPVLVTHPVPEGQLVGVGELEVHKEEVRVGEAEGLEEIVGEFVAQEVG